MEPVQAGVPPTPLQVACPLALGSGTPRHAQPFIFCYFFTLKDEKALIYFIASFPSLPLLLTFGARWFSVGVRPGH